MKIQHRQNTVPTRVGFNRLNGPTLERTNVRNKSEGVAPCATSYQGRPPTLDPLTTSEPATSLFVAQSAETGGDRRAFCGRGVAAVATGSTFVGGT